MLSDNRSVSARVVNNVEDRIYNKAFDRNFDYQFSSVACLFYERVGRYDD